LHIPRSGAVAHRIDANWSMVKTPRIRGELELLIAAAGRDDVWAAAHTYLGADATVIEHYTCRP
jgi:hypothetical protein